MDSLQTVLEFKYSDMNAIKKILIADTNFTYASKLSNYLTLHHCKVLGISSSLQDVLNIISTEFPDIIVINLIEDDINNTMLEIVHYVHLNLHIAVILLNKPDEIENIEALIATEPYTCIIISEYNFMEQILMSILFCNQRVYKDLENYKTLIIKTMLLNIDESGEPISKKGMKHNFNLYSISFADIQCISAGNVHLKNFILLKLFSDPLHFVILRGTLKDWIQKLPASFFLRVHDAHIVQNCMIKLVKCSHEILIDKYHIPISKNNYKRIHEWYMHKMENKQKFR